MLSADQLRKGWEERALLFPIEPALTFAEGGVVLGAGTVLAARGTVRDGRATFAIDGCETRILTLLAVAHGRAVAPETIEVRADLVTTAARYAADRRVFGHVLRGIRVHPDGPED